ncbi:MAG TPA: hypothetical protein PKI14_12755 [Fervidobacterium sp.]|nr:hypothetical protein [Fervidobacterium sp.]
MTKIVLEERKINGEEARLIKDLLELIIDTEEGYLNGAYGFALGLEKVYEEIEEGITLGEIADGISRALHYYQQYGDSLNVSIEGE